MAEKDSKYPSDILPSTTEKAFRKGTDALGALNESPLGQAPDLIGNMAKGIATGLVNHVGKKLGSDVIDTVKSDYLTNTQKVAGVAGGIISITPVYADITRTFIPIPHVQLAASLAGLVGDIVSNKKEDAKRKSLNKKHITMVELSKIISEKNYGYDFYQHYQDYVIRQPYIYKTLYEFRDTVIADSNLPPKEKAERVLTINSIIERLSAEQDVSQPLQELEKLGDYFDNRFEMVNQFKQDNRDATGIVKKSESLINMIKKYEMGRMEFNQDPKLANDPALKKALQDYHEIEKKIFCQDLPHNTKKRIRQFSESLTPDPAQISLIKAGIENHLLNETVVEQIALQDADFNMWVAKTVLLPRQEVQEIESYYKQPRVILENLNQARLVVLENTQLSETEKSASLLAIDNEIMRMTILLSTPAENVETTALIVNQMSNMGDEVTNILQSTETFDKLLNDIEQLNELNSNFMSIMDSELLAQARDPADIEKLKKSIQLHRISSAVQFSQSMKGHFQTPSNKTTNDTTVTNSSVTPVVISARDIPVLQHDVMKELLNEIADDESFLSLSEESKVEAIELMASEKLIQKLLGDAGFERYRMDQETKIKHSTIASDLQSYYEKRYGPSNEIMRSIFEKQNIERSAKFKSGVIIKDINIIALNALGVIATPLPPLSALAGAASSAVSASGTVSSVKHNIEMLQDSKVQNTFFANTTPSVKDDRESLRKQTKNVTRKDMKRRPAAMRFSHNNSSQALSPSSRPGVEQGSAPEVNAKSGNENLSKELVIKTNAEIVKLLENRLAEISSESMFHTGHNARLCAINEIYNAVIAEKSDYKSGHKLIDLESIIHHIKEKNSNNPSFMNLFEKGIQEKSSRDNNKDSQFTIMRNKISNLRNQIEPQAMSQKSSTKFKK